jgi:succinate dehydrogenase / fumarate reductase iron-sulfur subunit
MSENTINLTLKVWRQSSNQTPGKFATYAANNIDVDMSFLEMLDVVNEDLLLKGEEPIAFDHDCREGICGSCSMVINGIPHGKDKAITTCQLHMRRFSDGEIIVIEPWRASAFPIIKDLAVDRSSFDRIIQAGGYISINAGNVQDANALPISKVNSDAAFDVAAWIGCGACVASCKNASAMLFVAAKVSQFALLPQGQPERAQRAERMVAQMDSEGFGNCTNLKECEAACPKEISTDNIARLNREYLKASLFGR